MARWEARRAASGVRGHRAPADRGVPVRGHRARPESPVWDPAVTSITKTSPGPMGVGTTARLVRSDRRRQLQGSMKVTEYQPVSSFTVVSRFRPFTLQARTTFAPVAPASTSLQLVIDTTPAGSWGWCCR